MVKVYELTTSGSDGWNKFLVRGINSESEARQLAKRVFGRYYWDAGIVYYADTTKKQGYKTAYGNETMTKAEFLGYKKSYKNKEKILKERFALNYPNGIGM